MKTCSMCRVGKEDSQFYTRILPSGNVTLFSRCKGCHTQYNKERYASKYAEYSKRYRAKNVEKRKETVKLWDSRNREAVRAKTNRRRRRVKLAQPAWYETDLVALVYKKAQQFGFEVDHIIPLSHPQVCGLHCWHNLQLLDSELNRIKSNNF